MQREGALDAHAVGNLANGVGLTGSGTGAGDHDALEHLHTGLVAFDDLHVNLHSVASAEVGNVVAQRGGVDGIEGLHRCFSSCKRHKSPTVVWNGAVLMRPLWQTSNRPAKCATSSPYPRERAAETR